MKFSECWRTPVNHSSIHMSYRPNFLSDFKTIFSANFSTKKFLKLGQKVRPSIHNAHGEYISVEHYKAVFLLGGRVWPFSMVLVKMCD